MNLWNNQGQIVSYLRSFQLNADYYIFADEMKSDDALEGRLNGDKDTLDEMDDGRKEDKNGFKAKFMFNIADGGFTGENAAAATQDQRWPEAWVWGVAAETVATQNSALLKCKTLNLSARLPQNKLVCELTSATMSFQLLQRS